MSPRQLSSPGGTDVPPVQSRILVVDADRDVLWSVSEQLRELGFDVVTEKTPAAWLSLNEAEQDFGSISGILLELQSPILSGLTALLQVIRDRHSNIPIIVMAEARDIARLRKAVEMGAREYLVKPFDTELLKRKCLQVFRGVAQGI